MSENNTYEILKSVLTGDTLALQNVNNTYECFQAVHDETNNALRVNVTNLTGGTTSPSGSDTEIQYNDSGSFGAESAFTYNQSTNTLGIDNITPNGGGNLILKSLSNDVILRNGTGPSEKSMSWTSNGKIAIASPDAAAFGNINFTLTAGTTYDWTFPAEDGTVVLENASGDTTISNQLTATDIVCNGETHFTSQKRVTMVTASTYTLDAVEDEVLMVMSTACTINLPLQSTIPNNGKMFTYYVYKLSTGGYCDIITPSGHTFPLGYTKQKLFYPEEFLHVGASTYGYWGKISSLKIASVAQRVGAWDASNFTSYTPIPFTSAPIEDNDEIFEWSGTTMLVCKIPTRINANYAVDVDSTGGGTWNIFGRIIINGTDVVSLSNRISGNYGGEDDTLTLPTIPIDLNAGDYIELEVTHTNLTGNIDNAFLNIDSLI